MGHPLQAGTITTQHGRAVDPSDIGITVTAHGAVQDTSVVPHHNVSLGPDIF